MAHPTRSAPQVAIPLPSDAAVRRVIGKSYDPERTLNVINADSDEAGHVFQSEAGHLFRCEAGRCSDLMSAT
jgi:hypothetical protein